MTETILQLPAEIVKVETRRNGAIRLIIDSQEDIQPDIRAKMMNCVDKVGWLSYLPTTERMLDPLDIAGLPEIRPEEQKSPAQRLRAVLHVKWEQEGRKGTSEDFYRTAMEKIIEHYKSQLA